MANRVCELLGILGLTYYEFQIPAPELHYACLKLMLACSEGFLIYSHIYQATYKERYLEHSNVKNFFNHNENELILTAYRAKLGINNEFFDYPIGQFNKKYDLVSIINLV